MNKNNVIYLNKPEETFDYQLTKLAGKILKEALEAEIETFVEKFSWKNEYEVRRKRPWRQNIISILGGTEFIPMSGRAIDNVRQRLSEPRPTE